MSDLNLKQSKFCHEYLKDFNGTKAALRSGYSERSAGSIAAENLQKPEIRAEIARLSKSHFEAQGLTINRVLLEVVAIAFGEKSTASERLKALEILLKHKASEPQDAKRDFSVTAKDVLERLAKMRKKPPEG